MTGTPSVMQIDQLDPGVGRLEMASGGERGRHVDDRDVRLPVCGDGLATVLKTGTPATVLPAAPGRHARRQRWCRTRCICPV